MLLTALNYTVDSRENSLLVQESTNPSDYQLYGQVSERPLVTLGKSRWAHGHMLALYQVI
jgi:hypothetical protein